MACMVKVWDSVVNVERLCHMVAHGVVIVTSNGAQCDKCGKMGDSVGIEEAQWH